MVHSSCLQLATQNVFYKQRNNLFFPVSAFTLPTTVLRIPYSLIFGGLWACFVYYVVGFSPTWSRCALQPRHVWLPTMVASCRQLK